LKCPKSDVEVVRGLKSRDKTVAIAGIDVKEGWMKKIREKLLDSIE